MHVVVAGASGATGRHVVDEALEAGHRVTALVRDPARYRAPETVAVLQADVVADARIDLPADTDAVVSALGKTELRSPESTCLLGVVHLLAAMQAAGIRRVVVVSAQPVLRSGQGLGWFGRWVLLPIVRLWGREIYPDLTRMEAYLRDRSRLCDWTVVRPGHLRDADRSDRFRLAPEQNVPGDTRRPDLAAALVQLLDDETAYGRAYGIASTTGRSRR